MTLKWDLHSRSDGNCEFCLRPIGDEAHVHHRKLRSQGGTNDLDNVVLIHPICHHWAHMNPAEAYQRGWLVHGWDDPSLVPIVHCLPR